MQIVREPLNFVLASYEYFPAMYYNDTVSRSIKRLVRKRRQYKYINLQKETSPLLKNGPPNYWDFKVQIEGKTPVWSSSSTSSDSDVIITDGRGKNLNVCLTSGIDDN